MSDIGKATREFEDNVDRADIWVNGGIDDSYEAKDGTKVPTIKNLNERAEVNIDRAKGYAESAAASATSAKISANIYSSVSDGLSATTNGQYFSVDSDSQDSFIDLYFNNNGSAEFRSSYPSGEYVKKLAPKESPVFTGEPTTPTAGLGWENPQQVANIAQVAFMARASSTILLESSSNEIDLTIEQSRRCGINFTGTIQSDFIVNFDDSINQPYSYFIRNVTQGSGDVVIKYKNGTRSLKIPKSRNVAVMSNGSEFFMVNGDIDQYVYDELLLKANILSPVFTGFPQCPTATLNWNTPQQISNIAQSFLISRTSTAVDISGGEMIELTASQSRLAGIHFTGSIHSDVTVVFNTEGITNYSYTIRNATLGSGNVFIKYSHGSKKTPVPKNRSTLFMSNGSEFFLVSNVTDSDLSSKANINSPSFTGKPTTPSAGLNWESPQQVVNIAQNLAISRKSEFINLTGSDGEYHLGDANSRLPAIHFFGSLTKDVEVVISSSIGSAYNYIFRNSTLGGFSIFIKYDGKDNSVELKSREVSSFLGNGQELFRVSDYSSEIKDLRDDLNGALNDYGVLTDASLTLEEKTHSTIMVAMTKDRCFGFNSGTNVLNITKDDGKTWELLHSFSGYQTEAIVPLSNGELLVTGFNTNQSGFAWLSYGLGTEDVTFKEVLKTHSKYTKFTQAWSMFECNNIVLAIDYGAKAGSSYGNVDMVPDGENARYAYLSLDYGKTWETIFDLNEFIISNGYGTDVDGVMQARGVHCHGIAYDKWWDRIWITFGDNAYKIGGTIYSDDFGATWHWANKGKDSVYASPSGSRHQNVGIKPMPDCILFGSDSEPNGVHRIDRSQGKKITGEYIIDIAYQFGTEDRLAHLCHGIYQAEHLPNSPVFFAFGSEGISSKSFIVATYDGYDFKLIWESDTNMYRGFGPRSIVAPTARGNLIMKVVDNIDGVIKAFQATGSSPTYGNKYI